MSKPQPVAFTVTHLCPYATTGHTQYNQNSTAITFFIIFLHRPIFSKLRIILLVLLAFKATSVAKSRPPAGFQPRLAAIDREYNL